MISAKGVKVKLLIFVLILFSLSSCAAIEEFDFRRSPDRKIKCLSVFDDLVAQERGWRLSDKRDSIALTEFDQSIQVTQSEYGRPSVANRIEKLSHSSFKDIKTMLQDNPIPYVLGPDGKRYIIDRHHFSLSFYEYRDEIERRFPKKAHKLKVEFQRVDLIENPNSQELSFSQFERVMKRLKLVYLKGIEERGFGSLPRHLSGLREDHYRGLAWVMRKSKIFDKSDIPFAEFYWGEYYKKKLGKAHLPATSHPSFTEEHLRAALKVSLDSEASSLPGFKGDTNMSTAQIKARIEKAYQKLEEKGLINLLNRL